MQRLIDGLHHFRRDVYPKKRELFSKLAKGHAWVYGIGDGSVRHYDDGAGRFVEFAEELRPIRRHLAAV